MPSEWQNHYNIYLQPPMVILNRLNLMFSLFYNRGYNEGIVSLLLSFFACMLFHFPILCRCFAWVTHVWFLVLTSHKIPYCASMLWEIKNDCLMFAVAINRGISECIVWCHSISFDAVCSNLPSSNKQFDAVLLLQPGTHAIINCCWTINSNYY